MRIADIKQSLFKIRIMYSVMIVLVLSLMVNVSNAAETKLSPQWTERYLFKYAPNLVKNTHTDHVLAFYYFGSFQNFTIMGMERVKGDDYEPHHTVLIFKNSVLQGYYEELLVFPGGVSEQGQVFFPANRPVNENIDLAKGLYPVIIFNNDPDSAAVYQSILPL